MEITFLGTGTSQGIPVINCNHPVCNSTDKKDKRLRSSVLISVNNKNFVIDCGPDFRYQMLRARITDIRGILFTHEHADHTSGLDDIRPFSFKMGGVPFYAEKRVFNNLKDRFSYIFTKENKYPGAPTVICNEINTYEFKIDDIAILPIRVMHHDLPVLGFRFYNIAYLTDVKTISDEALAKLKNLDVLIINALRKEKHHSHLNLEEALKIISKINPKRAYLTHISHLMGFHKEVEKELP
ncbi:MAG: MBL fold metallo-hydrolase, partial [Lutibacter sp.]